MGLKKHRARGTSIGYSKVLYKALETFFPAQSSPKDPHKYALSPKGARPDIFWVSDQKLQTCHQRPHILEILIEKDKCG